MSGRGFDVWVINLDRDADRLAHMRAECARVGIRFERFSAFRADTVPADLRPAFFDESGAPHAPLRPGEIGCYASHLAVLQRIAAGTRPGLVMEDDVRLFPAFGDLEGLIAAAPADWAFLRLINPPKSPCLARARAGETRLVEYWRVPSNAGAYLVAPAGARRFLAAYRKRLLPFDEDLRRVWEHGCITYGALPPLAASSFFQSSIDAAGVRGDVPARTRFKAARRGNAGDSAWRWILRRWGPGGFAAGLWSWLKLSSAKRLRGRRRELEDHIV